MGLSRKHRAWAADVASYVNAVARTNVVLGLAEIRRGSPSLEEIGKERKNQDRRRDVRSGDGAVEFVG